MKRPSVYDGTEGEEDIIAIDKQNTKLNGLFISSVQIIFNIITDFFSN